MKVLMLTDNDPAGMGIAFTNAINRHTKHSCRLITTSEKYCFGFEKDIHIDNSKKDILISDIHLFPTYQECCDVIESLLIQSDILHFNILSDEEMSVGPFKVKDFIKGKKIVHHHHGHPKFRSNPDFYRLKYKKLNRKVLVSTPDLKLGLPDAYWMPNLVPLNDPLYHPSDERYDTFTVGHSPTRTDLKDTVSLLEAAHKARVNVDIIMNTSHSECLKRKSKCNAIFDHLQGYYGVSSLEGLAQDKYVIANLSLWVETHIKEFAETEKLPWLKPCSNRPLNELLTVIQDWIRHKREPGSRQWMLDHWSDKKVVERLIKFYETL